LRQRLTSIRGAVKSGLTCDSLPVASIQLEPIEVELGAIKIMLSLHPSVLVIIDPSVENYHHLVNGVIPEANVIVLDPTEDGVEQITQGLQKRSHIKSLHLVTHGSPGCLYLGTTQLKRSTLNYYDRDLQIWSDALTTDADILIYGCHVAANCSTGYSFIHHLSQLTGAKVAAATHLIGAAELGGNWELEVTTGRIETSLAFEADVLATYKSVLAASFNLSDLNGINGFAINGINSGDFIGLSVSSTGDINNDGIDDVIIGNHGFYNELDHHHHFPDTTGQSYIVFGSSEVGTNGSFNLSDLNGNNGFWTHKIDIGDHDDLGHSVSGVGDINNDGIDDLIIGAPDAEPHPPLHDAGQSYVVFGGTDVGSNGSLELSALNGNNGFVINGIDREDFSGYSVSGAGDINNDGIDDLIIGAPGDRHHHHAGQSYVVFGATDVGSNGSLELSALNGSNGFVINGIDREDFSGYSVSEAGDINNDGIDDLIIGAPGYRHHHNDDDAGQSYVIFGAKDLGETGSLELSELNGNNGFVVTGVGSPGVVVGSAGDMNGDGVDDLIIGNPFIDSNGNHSTGQSYVIFGSTDVGTTGYLDIFSLDGSNGFIINGIDEYDGLRGGDGAGDINNDGVDDLIIGAAWADPNGNINAGESYVVFGNIQPELDLNGSATGINYTAIFTGTPISLIDSTFTLTDLNSTTLSSATIAIINPLDGTTEFLAANTTNTNITTNYDTLTGTLTLTGVDTLANYQQVLNSITYNNTTPTPNTTARTIEFIVNDGAAHSHTSTLATTTLIFESIPSFTSQPITEIEEDNSYNYIITTTDTDQGDTLTIRANTLPAWLTFTDNQDGTATLIGTPTNEQVGVHEIELIVEDGTGNSSTQSFEITVININDAPKIVQPIPDQNATVSTPFTVDIRDNFTDIDVGDTLTYSATDLPDGLSLNPDTGIITGTPTNNAIGTNTVTVTASDNNGDTINDTFDITVAPINPNNDNIPVVFRQTTNQLFVLDGKDGQAQLKFTLTERKADFVNEVGVFLVEDQQGTINGITPGQPGYFQAAFDQAQVIFSALGNNEFSDLNFTRNLGVNVGEYLGFYLVQNSTTDTVLKNLDAGRTPPPVFLATNSANRDEFNHLQISDLGNNSYRLAWEDLLGGGDQDFNDLVLTVELTNESSSIGTQLQTEPQGELIDLRQLTPDLIPADFVVNEAAAYDNSFGFYAIDDPTGRIGNLNPGDPGYAEAAINQRLDLSTGLPGGQLLAPFLIADSTPEEFLANNPNNQPDQGALAYFAYLEANPDGVDHLRLLGDNTFGFEDLLGGGDLDYNDLVIQVNFS